MKELVRRAQGGDHRAFEALYRETVGHVYAVCLRLSADPGEAEELTQSAFVRAWEKLGIYREQDAFLPWLRRLAVNLFLETRRSESRRASRVIVVDDPSRFERQGTRPDTEAAIDLERAISALPEGARTVFVLHDVEGYPHNEIAELMGLAEGTSKAQLHRARKLLREALEE